MSSSSSAAQTSTTAGHAAAVSYPGWHSMVAGGMAGLGSRMVTAPLDLIRIRRQLETNVTYPRESLFRSWKNIIEREGGITALYRGNLAAVYLWVGYSAVQFSLYNHIKEQLNNNNNTITNNNNATITAFVSGAGAGVGATLSTYPFDLCRTAFAARSGGGSSSSSTTTATSSSSINTATTNKANKRPVLPFSSLYEPSPHQRGGGGTAAAVPEFQPKLPPPASTEAPRSFAEFTRVMYMQRGLRGFYAGSFPAVVQIVPYMGLNFAIYDYLTNNSTWVSVSMFAGSISGLLSKMMVYPLDTVKRRMQAQAFYASTTTSTATATATATAAAAAACNDYYYYTGMVDCIRTVWKQEGVSSFYRGMVPSVLKTAISTSLSFALFRWTKNVLEQLHGTRNSV